MTHRSAALTTASLIGALALAAITLTPFVSEAAGSSTPTATPRPASRPTMKKLPHSPKTKVNTATIKRTPPTRADVDDLEVASTDDTNWWVEIEPDGYPYLKAEAYGESTLPITWTSHVYVTTPRTNADWPDGPASTLDYDKMVDHYSGMPNVFTDEKYSWNIIMTMELPPDHTWDFITDSSVCSIEPSHRQMVTCSYGAAELVPFPIQIWFPSIPTATPVPPTPTPVASPTPGTSLPKWEIPACPNTVAVMAVIQSQDNSQPQWIVVDESYVVHPEHGGFEEITTEIMLTVPVNNWVYKNTHIVPIQPTPDTVFYLPKEPYPTGPMFFHDHLIVSLRANVVLTDGFRCILTASRDYIWQ